MYRKYGRTNSESEESEMSEPPRLKSTEYSVKYEARERDERAECRRSHKYLHRKEEKGKGSEESYSLRSAETPRALKARARPTAAGRKLAGV